MLLAGAPPFGETHPFNRFGSASVHIPSFLLTTIPFSLIFSLIPLSLPPLIAEALA